MVERLAEIRRRESLPGDAEKDDGGAGPWRVNRPALIPVYREEIARTTHAGKLIDLHLKLGEELLCCSRSEEALQAFGLIEKILAQVGGQLGPEESGRLRAHLREQLSICFIRMGERENCVAGHTPDSCIFPIGGEGIHRVKRGSQAAIEVLGQSLDEDPRDLGSRWLLNLAHMTLGQYPSGVPAERLIPPAVFAPEHEVPRFRDIAPSLGVDVFGLAGGSIVEDLDGDGDLDIFASGWSLEDQARCFLNDGRGGFIDHTEEAGLIGECGGLNLAHADYDNDGHADVLIRRGGWLGDRGTHPSSLLRNRGDASFDDVTEDAGLLTFHPGQAAVWADYDGDGWLDLFFGNEGDRARPHPCQLFRNDGDGTFTDVAARVGLADLGFVKGAAWGDYNNDGRPDLYISRLREMNMLFRNDGPKDLSRPWTFTDVTGEASVGEPRDSFPTWFFDFDNDGWEDLFVAGFNKASISDVAALYLGLPHKGETPRLYRNRGDGTFEDVTRQAGLDRVLLVMGANFGDVDNDGFLDMYLGTGSPDLRTLMPNRMFRNAEGKRFQDVTTSAGVGHVQKGHGVAFGDLDHDGDQDLYAVMGGWYSGDGYQNALFENPGSSNRWITLDLEGVRSNRSGIGARIRVTVLAGGAAREIHATAGTGGSFGSSSLRQEIGLGRADTITSIRIGWPSGLVQELKGVPMDRAYRVREGDAEPVPLERKAFRFSARPGSHRGQPGHEHH
jgi:hypothetical protein